MYAKELPAFKFLTICSYQKVTIMNFYDMRKSHQPQYEQNVFFCRDNTKNTKYNKM